MSLALPGNGPVTLPSGSLLAADPATGDRSSLIATMKKFADEFPALLASPGWTKLPNGIVVQWGLATATVAGTAITFPVAFSTANFIVLPGTTNGNSIGAVSAGNVTSNGFTLYAGASISSTWFAIGR